MQGKTYTQGDLTEQLVLIQVPIVGMVQGQAQVQEC